MTLYLIDRLVALLTGVLCIVVMLIAWAMRGDAGIFPFFAGGLGLVASGWLALSTRRHNLDDESETPALNGPRLLFWSGSLLGLLLLLEPLGTFVVLPLFLIINLRVLAAQRWALVLPITLTFTLAIYVVFDHLLAVPLPPGVLAP